MPQRPHTWRDQAHGCYTFDNADLGFVPSDLIAHFPVFLHLRAALREWLPGGLVVVSNAAVVSLAAAGAVILVHCFDDHVQSARLSSPFASATSSTCTSDHESSAHRFQL